MLGMSIPGSEPFSRTPTTHVTTTHSVSAIMATASMAGMDGMAGGHMDCEISVHDPDFLHSLSRHTLTLTDAVELVFRLSLLHLPELADRNGGHDGSGLRRGGIPRRRARVSAPDKQRVRPMDRLAASDASRLGRRIPAKQRSPLHRAGRQGESRLREQPRSSGGRRRRRRQSAPEGTVPAEPVAAGRKGRLTYGAVCAGIFYHAVSFFFIRS